MEVRAVNKFTGLSAQKTRWIVNEVRGRQAEEALQILEYMPQAAAREVHKTVKSALANATENFGLESEDMYITQIFTDEAPTRKWRRFGARGRFKPWLRRSSHITVILEERYEFDDDDDFDFDDDE